jgi:hypothetical protein
MNIFLSVLLFIVVFSVQGKNETKLVKLYSGRSCCFEKDSVEIMLNAKYGFRVIDRVGKISRRDSKKDKKNQIKLRLANGSCWQIEYDKEIADLESTSNITLYNFFYLDSNTVKVKLVSRIGESDNYKINWKRSISCWRESTVLCFEVVSVKTGKLTGKHIEISVYNEINKFYKHRNNPNKVYKLKIAREYHCNSAEQTEVFQIID